jgi:nitroreductase
MLARRSFPRVTGEAPAREELLRLVSVAATAADHGALKPWRLLELRGSAREGLGAALAAATVQLSPGPDAARRAEKAAAKPLRAPLLIAIVAAHRPSQKVAGWEQDVAAAGVGHLLSLLLDDAGWAVMWRTGNLVDSAPVRAFHRLAEHEHLLGWLYVGGRPPETPDHKDRTIDPTAFLGVLRPDADAGPLPVI